LPRAKPVLRELRDDDLTGYDRLQQLLTTALVDNFLGRVRLSQGDNDAAARLFTDGLTVARGALDSIPILISLYDLALASQARGDLAGATGHLKEGLALAAEAGDETSAAYYLEVLAAVAGQQDNPPGGRPVPCGCVWQSISAGPRRAADRQSAECSSQPLVGSHPALRRPAAAVTGKTATTRQLIAAAGCGCLLTAIVG